VSSSSNRSRNTESPYSLLQSSTSNLTKQEQNNAERIQLIVDDINNIVEKCTRELDDTLCSKTSIRSPSIDYISHQNRSFISSNSLDALCQSKIKTFKQTNDKSDYCIHSSKDEFINQFNKLSITNDPPPLPPKRQTGYFVC
jgi:hypothetical protein